MQYAHRYYKTTRQTLSPVSASPTGVWSAKLVFAPGYYAYNGAVYDLTQPGHYVMTHQKTAAEPWCNTTRMTVFGGDPIALVSAAAWLNVFGDGDKPSGETDAQWMDRISAKARTSKFALLCGHVHPWAQARLLQPNGVASRQVYFLTMETPNNCVDGHVALEVTMGGAPVLVDLSTNSTFRSPSDNLLSARDAVAHIATGTVSYDPIAADCFAVETANDAFDSTSYAEAFLAFDADLTAWHHRIFQAVGMMASDGRIYFKLPPGSEHRKSWVLSLSSGYRVIDDPAQWDALFYP